MEKVYQHETYRNKKNKRLYWVQKICKDATNSREGNVIVVYYDVENENPWYARDLEEFKEKFEAICED